MELPVYAKAEKAKTIYNTDGTMSIFIPIKINKLHPLFWIDVIKGLFNEYI